jgi:hypothetical protein
MINAGQAPSIKYAAGGSQIMQPTIIGLATDSNFSLQRSFWDANTGAIVGFADNFNPASNPFRHGAFSAVGPVKVRN